MKDVLPVFTHEDILKDAWVSADLSVEELEVALDTFWNDGLLPEWWSPGGLPMYPDPTKPERY